MELKEAIKFMDEGVKYYKLIVAKNSSNLIKECKELNLDSIKKIDISSLLVELLDGMTQEEREFESWDILKQYLDSLEEDILVLYNVDYMFSPDLGNLDVISNLNYYSRNDKVIILFLDAKMIGNDLIYSNEGCKDYKRMDTSEVIMVGWNNEN